MLATHLGFYNTATSRTHVRFQFSTHAAAGGNVAPNSAFEAADLRIYKAADGAAFSATQRSSANGITMTSPFDSLTGFHDVDIDLTDNTDSGFYAAGGFYSVVLAPDETVDSQTLTGVVLAYFEIGVPAVNVSQFGGSAGTFASGRPEVNTTHAAGTAWGSGAITAASIASDAITAAKIASDAITAAKIATGAITAAKFASGAVDAAALATDAVTEIQSGLATAANLAIALQFLGHNTTIATLASQTSFTLTAGSADDNAYNGWGCFVIDASTATQVCLGVVSDYTGSTKTITLQSDPGIFTMAATDKVFLLPAKMTDGVAVSEIQQSALADLFNTDSGTDYASAATGSVVKEIADNAGGSALTTDAIAEAMFTYNATADYSTADAGSVVKQIADNAGGSSLTVEDIRTEMDSNSTQLAKLGTPAGASISADIAAVKSDTAAILTDTADMQPKLGTPAGASMSADIAAVKSQTAAIETDTQDLQTQIGTDGAGLTNMPWSASWDAEVQSEVTDALNAYDPPTRAEATSDVNSVLTILGTPAGADMAADVAAVKSDTAAILTDTGTTLDGKVDAIKTNTDKFANLPVLTAGGTGGQGYGAP